MKVVGRCLLIIIGTLVGAGFASGQEIAIFFNRFGDYGWYGSFFSSAFFGLIILFVLKNVSKKNYETLMMRFSLLRWINEIFLLISFCVMIAGVSAFFEQQLKLPYWIGSMIATSICYLVFSYRYKGLEVFNIILVPCIILGILVIGLGTYSPDAMQDIRYTLPKMFTNSWFLSSILYVGYNSLMLIPILITFHDEDLKNSQKYYIAFLSFAVFTILGFLLVRVMRIYFPQILVFELPTLKLAEQIGTIAKSLYSFIILFSIFTTAISCGYSFLKMQEAKYEKKAFILCIIAIFLSKIGFSKLVSSMFPIFGYFGIFQIIVIIYLMLKERRNK